MRSVLVAIFVFGIAVAALAGAKDDYAQGVSAFNSLLANEKRAGLRAEWLAVMKPFERSLKTDAEGEYAPKCMFFLGRSFEELARRSFGKDDRKAALDAFDRLLAAFPKHGWADDALYRKGLIWKELAGDQTQAEAMFKAVVANYPKGDMVAQARKQLEPGQGAPVAEAPAVRKETASKRPEPAGKDAARKSEATLLGIRHWSSPDYTRVVMDLSADVKYGRDLVEKTGGSGKQLRITLQRSAIAADVMPERSIRDGILSQIRVAADTEGAALVTFDLMQMDHYRLFTLPDPYRLVLDVYGVEGAKDSGGVQPAEAAVKPEQAPEKQAVQAEVHETDHVQAALAELQTKKQAAQKTGGQEKTPPAKAEAPPQKSVRTEAKKASVPPQEPAVTVSPKQKKLAGSLVEQLGLKVQTIMIDAGHGGKDPGAMANGVSEKDVNLKMAKMLGRMLQEQGFVVHYTRTGDTFIPLEERTAMANARNADLFLSLHCNAHKDSSIKGLEVYYLNLATDAQAVRVAARENGVSAKKISDMQFILSDLMLNSKINESRQMAALVEQETIRAMRPRHALSSHGSKGAFFYVLTGARMPSVLVELGYVTNAAEAAKLTSDAYLADMARGLVGGVVAYKKKLERFALNAPGKS